jgi:CRP-like cAMP-binding protein
MRHGHDPKMVRLTIGGLLDACTAREIAKIAMVADEVAAPPDTVLCHQGGAAHHCYVLLDGEAEVRVDGQYVGTVRHGEIVGELALLDHGRRSATVVTTTVCRLAAISASDYDALMDMPSFRRGVLRQVTGRFRGLDASFAATAVA